MDYQNWPKGRGGRIPNLSREYVNEAAGRLNLTFVADGAGDVKQTVGPDDIFAYIYAALHSPEYRLRYAEFLRIDFPRIPFPRGRSVFRKLCKVGHQLAKLHLMESEILEDDNRWPVFPEEGTSIVENGYPKYIACVDTPEKNKVHINKDQYFEAVKPQVWEFHIGGYQVCEKWLKDRRGRELSFDDIRHYQKMVVAVDETIRLMNEPCMSQMFE